MHGDVPSIVPRRNYDIRTQCLKGTCSSSELPGRWHVSLFLDAARPCRGCSSMFSPEASTWKGRLRVPLLDRIHCSGFPDGADDGVRTRGLLLGKQACCHCTTSASRGDGIRPHDPRLMGPAPPSRARPAGGRCLAYSIAGARRLDMTSFPRNVCAYTRRHAACRGAGGVRTRDLPVADGTPCHWATAPKCP